MNEAEKRYQAEMAKRAGAAVPCANMDDGSHR